MGMHSQHLRLEEAHILEPGRWQTSERVFDIVCKTIFPISNAKHVRFMAL